MKKSFIPFDKKILYGVVAAVCFVFFAGADDGKLYGVPPPFILATGGKPADTSAVTAQPMNAEPTISGIEKDAPKLYGAAAQGGLLWGMTGDDVAVYDVGANRKISADGLFVVGLGRDAGSPLKLEFRKKGAEAKVFSYEIKQRKYVEQSITVPQKAIVYSDDVKKRIKAESAALSVARTNAESDSARYFMNLVFPENLRGIRISTEFGMRRTYNHGAKETLHNAVDIAAPAGTDVHPVGSGVVIYAHDMYESGNTVVISHGHNVTSTYCHMQKLNVKAGDRVAPGDVIGWVGSTGASTTGAHLHLQMGDGFTRIDPLLVLNVNAKW